MMETVLRAAVAFVILYAITRASGRATLGELSSFDLLLFVTMGDLIQQGVTRGDTSMFGSVAAVATIALLAVLCGVVSVKWPRKIGTKLMGNPIILMRDGVVDEAALRRERISINELLSALRQQEITSFDEVSIGILEPNGKFSFYKTEKAQQS